MLRYIVSIRHFLTLHIVNKTLFDTFRHFLVWVARGAVGLELGVDALEPAVEDELLALIELGVLASHQRRRPLAAPLLQGREVAAQNNCT